MKSIIPFISLLICFTACQNEKEIIAKQEHFTKDYLFHQVDSSGVDFANQITEDETHSIINYIYYYNGAGAAVGDLNNNGLPDLFFVGNTTQNKLYFNKGDMKFEDVTAQAQIKSNTSWNTGVTMVDINQDGWLDIYVCAASGVLDYDGHNELYINNQDGTFTESSAEYGLDIKSYATQAYFFDYDQDGDLDMYLVNHAVHTTYAYESAENRNLRTASVGDLLFRNDNGKFVDVSEEAQIYGGANGYGLSATLADFNQDGWTDIYVSNDFHENDYYYINNQDGTFTEQLGQAFPATSKFSMGSDAADINGDGLPDLITLDMLPEDERVLKETEGDDAMYFVQQKLKNLGYEQQFSRNMLHLNHDQGKYFSEQALLHNIADSDWSWSALFADLNNNTHQDLFITNGILRRPNDLDFRKYVASAFKGRSQEEGLKWLYKSIDQMPSGKMTNKIYEGNSATFKSRVGEWIQDTATLSNGAVYADLDLDGDLDLVINKLNGKALIYENTTDQSQNHISFKLNFKKPNREAIGARIQLYTAGKLQTKTLYKSRGFLSSVDSPLHFGLGQHHEIDSIKVIWPNQHVQKLGSLAINQRHSIRYSDESPIHHYKEKEKQDLLTLTEILSFTHQEDQYNDFLNEKLIPYKVSTLGPAIAVGDVNGNGYEDIYIGNASGESGRFFINTGRGFVENSSELFDNEKMYEDNAAAFIDIDQDGDLDLYVGSGINTHGIKKFEKDRLYLFENGKFIKSENKIPDNTAITSSVIAGDFNNDSYTDLFIGNLGRKNNFGARVNSYILKNNGAGKLKKSTDFKLKSRVNSAVWKDLNNDKKLDLIIATEWDAPKIFLNTENGFKEQEVPEHLNGLWQSVFIYDIDQDGDDDILLGNWGLNSKFKPSETYPLKMYYRDFDENGKTEAILAYSKNGKYYPVNSKDELGAQMNFIHKRYVKHKDYALQTMEDIFTKERLKAAELSEIHTLASGYLENKDGEFTTFVPFPQELQLGPINTFNNIKIKAENQLFVAGNSMRANNYQGPHQAFKGYYFKTLNHIEELSQIGIPALSDEVKGIHKIETENEHLILFSINNAPIKVYSYDK
ncbi:MAG: VCBS repeat-containing protein [Psychroflexus sp.]|nr:VCBS repeat-containing protein [Psychroflexus sp.]MDN6309697.1 VCBS repeat-containing protein [Psychroflexus sp.]